MVMTKLSPVLEHGEIVYVQARPVPGPDTAPGGVQVVPLGNTPLVARELKTAVTTGSRESGLVGAEELLGAMSPIG
jgi:hypothetical protein